MLLKESKNLNIMVVRGEHLKKGFSSRGRGARFFSQSLRSWKKSAGFTLLELLIVIGIIAALSVVSVGFYANQQKAKILENTAQELANYLRYVQQKSVSQEGGNQWGVHFENLTSSYALYTFDNIDNNCATSSSPIETRYLPSGIDFFSPPSSSSTNISFNKLTGTNCSETSQSIVIQSTSSNATTTISVSSQGLITY